MTTIYRDNADRLSVSDAKRLILEALPPETSGEVYARVDENGEIDFEGPVELREVHGVQIYAGFIDRDFLPICEQLSIRPRMKYRPVFTDYNGDVSQDDTYTITHDEFVSLAELFGLLALAGKAPEQTAAPAPMEAVGALGEPAKDGPEKPLQRTAAQDAAILNEMEKQGFNPLALPKNPDGRPGVKAAIRTALLKHPLFTGSTVFDKAWERLAARADIVIQG